jgi:hypothetical protein
MNMDAGRRFVTKGFKRPIVVVLSHKGIQPLLLENKVCCWRSCRFGFELTVHPLIPTILVRTTRIGVHVHDLVFNEPHGKL